ncbi:MAG: MazG nucleotide pyrophosphohydrolase domain-containing protein [Candidatus Caenarcaniphilales bacterium]|nr:MazG nucleotide pyrophosphohydrolase domain-containing protein [Candidatus Caenarcaniphilales bacterium]
MHKLQQKQSEINERCGFQTVLVGLGLGIAAEGGELCDYLAKYTNLKKPKPGDDLDNLKHKIADECADVLVYLLQIANNLEFDLEEAYLKKCEKLLERHAIAYSPA